jgi:hypothetical protein
MDYQGVAPQPPKPSKDIYHLGNLPPLNNDDVGAVFYEFCDAAKKEKERYSINEKMLDNHALFRNAHWSNAGYAGVHSSALTPKNEQVSINFLFANILRTVANMTAENPTAEIIGIDGVEDESDQILNQRMKNWNNEAEHGRNLNRSALNMEIYGITFEKHVWNAAKSRMDTIILDPFSCFPAPGYYESTEDMPYFAQAYPMDIEAIRSQFNVPKKIEIYPEDTYSVLGEERKNTSVPSGTYSGSSNYAGNFAAVQHPRQGTDYEEEKALVWEIWVKDSTQVTESTEDTQYDDKGEPTVTKRTEKRDKYPGKIRVVHLTNSGNVVLNDQMNPNINPALELVKAQESFLFDKFPFFKANSYEDTTSVWGFAIAEQVGDILLKIDELFARITGYISRVTLPPLVLPKDCGIDARIIHNKPGMILEPSDYNASRGIRYLDVPSLPSNFFDVLQAYIGFFDRISQIEDADRGQAPSGVIAASAITALQERGAVMIRAKIRAMDYLVRNRGRCFISFMQNFGVLVESVEIDDERRDFQGVNFAGRKYNYVVESGSTFYKPSGQIQGEAKELYEMGAIDQQAMLEVLNFPNWKGIIERMGESQLGQVGEALIQAGIPEVEVQKIVEFAGQKQGGPGKRAKDGPVPPPNVGKEPPPVKGQ